MEKGILIKWHKAEGEAIKKDELLFELQTDKTVIGMDSVHNGIVRRIFVAEGDEVPVTLPIAIIGNAEEDISALVTEAAKKHGTDTPALSFAELPAETGRVAKISPRARKLAQKENVNVLEAGIVGSGFQGCIAERDVQEYLSKMVAVKATPVARKLAAGSNIDVAKVAGSGAHGKVFKADIEKELELRQRNEAANREDPDSFQELPYVGVQKIIGDRLTYSKLTAPHIYVTNSVDCGEALAFRSKINDLGDEKISINDIITIAVVKALVKFPLLNASLRDDKICVFRSVNIGIAVALEGSLIVPVIRNAQNKDLIEIGRTTAELTSKAHSGKLLPGDYSGGTFTISNMGMHHVENFAAIINPPEAGILAISSIRKTPVVLEKDGEDSIAVRPLMNITLSCDHRIVNGVMAAQFTNEVKNNLEQPLRLLFHTKRITLS